MTENKQQKGTPAGCCGADAKQACCEQMAKMMQNFCTTGEAEFDCAAMQQQMGCTPPQPAEEE